LDRERLAPQGWQEQVAEDDADQQLPEDGRLPKALGDDPADLGRHDERGQRHEQRA
jgi:hypothetical protein